MSPNWPIFFSPKAKSFHRENPKLKMGEKVKFFIFWGHFDQNSFYTKCQYGHLLGPGGTLVRTKYGPWNTHFLLFIYFFNQLTGPKTIYGQKMNFDDFGSNSIFTTSPFSPIFPQPSSAHDFLLEFYAEQTEIKKIDLRSSIAKNEDCYCLTEFVNWHV